MVQSFLEVIHNYQNNFSSWNILSLITFICLICIFWFVKSSIVTGCFRLLYFLTKRTKEKWDDELVFSFQPPLEYFIYILMIYGTSYLFPFDPVMYSFLFKMFRACLITLGVWGIYRLFRPSSHIYEIFDDRGDRDPSVYTTFFSKVVRIAAVSFGISILLQEFGFNVQGFIAGLGIGSLAVALAAKDTIANIFGGFVILFDRPFEIGDWIKTSKDEGVVEEINIRSVKIRQFDDSVIFIPNANISNDSIINFSKWGKRRITFHLKVSIQTPLQKLKTSIAKIEEMLNQHDDVHPDTIFVKLNHLNDSGLEILLYFFTKETDWEKHLDVKQDVYFKVLEICRNENIHIPYPTQEIYLKQSDGQVP